MEPDIFPYNVQDNMQAPEPIGIAPLIEGQKTKLPDFKEIALNVAKNKALEFVGQKIGLNQAQTTGVASILGVGQNFFPPLAFASALTGRSLGISDYLNNKRSQKQAIKRNINNDPQGTINTVPVNIMNMQPTAQDTARGNIGTKTTSAPTSVSRQSRQTSGVGGLHSGY